MTTAFKWACTITAILTGASAGGAIGESEPPRASVTALGASLTVSDEGEAASGSTSLPACAFAAVIGCF